MNGIQPRKKPTTAQTMAPMSAVTTAYPKSSVSAMTRAPT